MIHIPGKEIVIDYMSRHALRDSERTGVEKYVRAVTQADHAVVLERIPTETEQDACHANGCLGQERPNPKAVH